VYEDLVYIHKRHVAAAGYPRDEMTMAPVTYDDMRPGRITFETDYPHTDSTWPHSRGIVATLLDGLDAESIHKIVRGDAIHLFELQGFQ
jgi:hypothetical protein